MMKRAIIDQIMLWIVIFVAFVIMFFMVIDYYMVMKTKERTDALANYSVRMKALGRDDANITEGLNRLKSSYFDTVVEDDLTCNDLGTESYKVVMKTNIFINNHFISENKKIYSYASAFNEYSSLDINCSLNLRLAE